MHFVKVIAVSVPGTSDLDEVVAYNSSNNFKCLVLCGKR